MFDLTSFWKEEAFEIRTFQCPACKETISADVATCRFCDLSIDPNTKQQLLTENQRVTAAVAHANTFRLSTHAAVLLTGIGLFLLYTTESSNPYLILSGVMAIAYGVHWLRRNASLVTPDPDYPLAIRKVKTTTVVWLAAVVLQLAVYIMINGLPVSRQLIAQLPSSLHKIIYEGNKRPVLSMGEVTASEIPPSPDQSTPFPAIALIGVVLKNDGKTSAHVTKTVAQIHLLSGDCDVRPLDDASTNLNREVPPGAPAPFFFGVEVKSPCKMSFVLKVNVVYTNLASGIEYTQEVSSPKLSFEYPGRTSPNQEL